MSGRFVVGVIFGALAALTPPITVASLALGAWVLVVHGIPEAEDTATDGVIWASVWATLLFGILLVVVVGALGLLYRPNLTLFIGGGFLLAFLIQWWMDWNRSGKTAYTEGEGEP